MEIKGDNYSFEIPEKWKDIIGTRRKGRNVDIILLWEEDTGCSGLLVRIRSLKRKLSEPDEYTEYLGRITSEDEENRFLYASYGREGAVSEENEDLYWRIRDQLYLIFDSIAPASGCLWQKADQI